MDETKHGYKIKYEVETGTEFHSCTCNDFSDSFRIAQRSVQSATAYRADIAQRFAEHVERVLRDAYCDEHPLVHVVTDGGFTLHRRHKEGAITSEVLTADGTLSDERFHDECAMRAMEAILSNPAVLEELMSPPVGLTGSARSAIMLVTTEVANAMLAERKRRLAPVAPIVIAFPREWIGKREYGDLRRFAATLFGEFVVVPSTSDEPSIRIDSDGPLDPEKRAAFEAWAAERMRG